MTQLKILVILFVGMLFDSQAGAQTIDDWEARPNASLKYKINKNWTVTGTYYLYLEDNMSRYNKSVLGGEINYKINNWMKAGMDYRHGLKKNKNYHDVRYAVTFKVKPTYKWSVSYKPTLQQEISAGDKKSATEYFLRNRLTLSYEPVKNLEFFVFSENYFDATRWAMDFYKQKSALGADYKLNKRHNLGMRMELINKRNGKNVMRPNVSYTYTIGKKK